jgi:hypothetical protein
MLAKSWQGPNNGIVVTQVVWYSSGQAMISRIILWYCGKSRSVLEETWYVIGKQYSCVNASIMWTSVVA